MKQNNRYQKLGGWLLCAVIFFFLQLAGGIVFQFSQGGLMDVIRGWEMYVGAQGWLQAAGQVAFIVTAVISAFTAIAIVQRDPYFLRTRQTAFAAVAVNLLLQLVYGLLYGFVPYGQLMLILQGLGYALLLVLAMLYYARSERVRTYMGSDEYLRLALFMKYFLKKKNEGDPQ